MTCIALYMLVCHVHVVAGWSMQCPARLSPFGCRCKLLEPGMDAACCTSWGLGIWVPRCGYACVRSCSCVVQGCSGFSGRCPLQLG
ncbi:hypothetical protein COO60DRAFT_1501387 [Scenedesmus sp. NREL 46B-D3]|nr:hypothetical protein COO60DRAFT_1501387 [Scenedesmus sp. NREL 46B-D3]